MEPKSVAEYMAQHPDANVREVRQANGINPDDDMNDYRALTDVKPPTDYYVKNGYPMLDIVKLSEETQPENKRTQNQLETPRSSDPAIRATKERNDIIKLWKNGRYFAAIGRVIQCNWF